MAVEDCFVDDYDDVGRCDCDDNGNYDDDYGGYNIGIGNCDDGNDGGGDDNCQLSRVQQRERHQCL